MFYDLDGLETYLYKIIEDYMEFGVIDSDVDFELYEILIADIITLDALEVGEKNQSQKLTTLYADEIKEKLLAENISKIDQYFNKPIDNKKLIKALLTSYRTTCFLIAKQIFEKKV
ncbi:MAG: hypothetical protein HQ534_12325 [Armatimonadetes bacterium]|nr:hypothetical protein [Armatimonadota bacterium]